VYVPTKRKITTATANAKAKAVNDHDETGWERVICPIHWFFACRTSSLKSGNTAGSRFVVAGFKRGGCILGSEKNGGPEVDNRLLT
jgi:hypothetical protein